jgi:hypothetical protein
MCVFRWFLIAEAERSRRKARAQIYFVFQHTLRHLWEGVDLAPIFSENIVGVELLDPMRG